MKAKTARHKAPEMSIVMPAYNEEQNIEATVRKCAETLKSMGFDGNRGEIVVTNDGSKDRTPEVMKTLRNGVKNLVIVEHKVNMGYGAGLADAVAASRGRLVATIDSDGQFDVSELPKLLEKKSEGYDVVSGYRLGKKDSALKVVLDRGFRLLNVMIFGLRLKDPNCAFKLYDGELVRSLHFDAKGYQTPTELMVKVKSKGVRIGEVGVSHAHRVGGRSSLKPFTVAFETMFYLLYLKMKEKLYRANVIRTF